MGRKSTKQVRFDSLSQREQHRQLKNKQFTKRKDGNRWGDKMLKRLHALDDERTEAGGTEMARGNNNLKIE